MKSFAPVKRALLSNFSADYSKSQLEELERQVEEFFVLLPSERSDKASFVASVGPATSAQLINLAMALEKLEPEDIIRELSRLKRLIPRNCLKERALPEPATPRTSRNQKSPTVLVTLIAAAAIGLSLLAHHFLGFYSSAENLDMQTLSELERVAAELRLEKKQLAKSLAEVEQRKEDLQSENLSLSKTLSSVRVQAESQQATTDKVNDEQRKFNASYDELSKEHKKLQTTHAEFLVRFEAGSAEYKRLYALWEKQAAAIKDSQNKSVALKEAAESAKEKAKVAEESNLRIAEELQLFRQLSEVAFKIVNEPESYGEQVKSWNEISQKLKKLN